MADSALTIARNVADVVGVERPDTLKGATSEEARAMLALMNEGGKQLLRERNSWGGPWVRFQREHTFQTVVGQAEYSLPSDYVDLVSDTLWNRDNYRRLRGPLSPQEKQVVESGLVQNTSISPYYWLQRSSNGRTTSIYFDPTPSAIEEFVLEYASNSWVISADGQTFRTQFEEDTDEPLFDDDLVQLDLKWRFLKSIRLSYVAELAEFERERDRRLGFDNKSRPIRLGKQRSTRFFAYVPDTGYGG